MNAKRLSSVFAAFTVVMLSCATPVFADVVLSDGGPGLATIQTWQVPELAVYLPSASARLEAARRQALSAQARLEEIEASLLESSGYSRNDLYKLDDDADMSAQVAPFRLIVAKAKADVNELQQIMAVCAWSVSLVNYYQSGLNANLAPVWPYPGQTPQANAESSMMGGGK